MPVVPQLDLPHWGDSWQKVAIALLGVTGFACLHFCLYHLHDVILPFVLGGFIVLALQPSVELIFRSLAGLGKNQRWCCCCCRRKQKGVWECDDVYKPGYKTDSGNPPSPPPSSNRLPRSQREIADQEKQPLVPEAGETDMVTDIMDGICRGLAVTIVFAAMISIVALTVVGICHGAMHLRDTWPSYKEGIRRIERIQEKTVDRLGNAENGAFGADRETMEHVVLEKMQEYIWEIVNYIIAGLPKGLSHLSIVMLYVLFWLYQPLPTGGTAGALVRSYLYKKTLVSVLFGVCVTLLFFLLGIDLAILFGMVAFFLNYVPEVGALLSIVIPMPVILLDGRLPNPAMTLLLATLGQLFLKFVFSNILEVKLIERDKEMSIHPVWVIFGLSYFGFVWGPMGMLISVPILAMIKTAAMSTRLVFPDDEGIPRLADRFLACLEGRKVHREDDDENGEPPKSPLLPIRLPLQLPQRTATPTPQKSASSSNRLAGINIPAVAKNVGPPPQSPGRSMRSLQ